jgi:hypothetical protein
MQSELTNFKNPYLEEYLRGTGGVKLSTYGFPNFDIEGSISRFQLRAESLEKYSYAIPDQEAIEALVEYSPVVEIGCGLGYWAHLVQQAGGEISPYDINVNDEGLVKLYRRDTYVKPYTEVFKGGSEVLEQHADKTLFLCWPPYDESMAYVASQTYLNNGGKTIIYVGEGNGGCTGDDQFHELLEERMERVKSIYIPVWDSIHDRMEIWRVKS